MSEVKPEAAPRGDSSFKLCILLLSANFLLVINSSLNFILYVILSPKFQLKVKKMWAAISSRESDVEDTNIFFVTE